MKRRIRCFTVALLLFGTGYTFNGYSQDFNSDYFVDSDFTLDQWTIEDGLPVNSVNQILQTSEGYLWLATFDGLVRFDGVRFKVYKSADYPGLPSNRIQSMANSADDVLWLQLEGDQLVKFENEEFELIDSTKGLNGEQVYCFYKPENSD
ncbi:MAG: two-component regulator propeller domain-containing protein, partial [Balneolaceae bacterium]